MRICDKIIKNKPHMCKKVFCKVGGGIVNSKKGMEQVWVVLLELI
jgi:hypothetical protein